MPGNGPVFQRGKRSTLSRCRICGRKLSSYNNTGQCWCHSVEDPEQNARWEPARDRSPWRVSFFRVIAFSLRVSASRVCSNRRTRSVCPKRRKFPDVVSHGATYRGSQLQTGFGLYILKCGQDFSSASPCEYKIKKPSRYWMAQV